MHKRPSCSSYFLTGPYFEHIKRWLESNLSREEYCKEHDIKLTTFMYWRKKYLESSKLDQIKNNAFTQVKIKEPIKPKIEPIKKHHTDSLVVILPSGIELVLPIDTENKRITSLIQSLWSVLC